MPPPASDLSVFVHTTWAPRAWGEAGKGGRPVAGEKNAVVRGGGPGRRNASEGPIARGAQDRAKAMSPIQLSASLQVCWELM